MSNHLTKLQDATIKQQCKLLRVPMMGSEFRTLAEQAIREKKTHLGYLETLLTAEVEEREKDTIDWRIKEARLPRLKTLEEFDLNQSPQVSAAKMAANAVKTLQVLLICCFLRNDRMCGRLTASQMASASLGSFFAPFFKDGLTNCGAIRRTVCPNVPSILAQKCAPRMDSIPTVHIGRFAR